MKIYFLRLAHAVLREKGDDFLIRQDGRIVGDGGEDYDGLRLDDAWDVFYPGQQFFQRARVFGEDFQRVVKIPGDVITFLDFRFVSHEAGETVAVFRAVETQKHKRHQVLVHHCGIEDRRVPKNDAGGFQLFQPLADGGNGERSLAAQIGKRGPRVFLQLAQNVPVNIVHTVIPPFIWYI